MVIPAVWHVVDFEEDVDPEFPTVNRPTFSRVPPSAYRLAEPGDTLDRIMIYTTAAGVVLARGLQLSRGGGLWPAALAMSLAGLWYSATPGPTVDGWYGLGWRVVRSPGPPHSVQRRSCRGCARGIVAINVYRVGISSAISRPCTGARVRADSGCVALLVAARQFEIPGVEPEGYWPRCAMIWGLLAFDLGMLNEAAPISGRLRVRFWHLGSGRLDRAGRRGDRSDLVSPPAGASESGGTGEST